MYIHDDSHPLENLTSKVATTALATSCSAGEAGLFGFENVADGINIFHSRDNVQDMNFCYCLRAP